MPKISKRFNSLRELVDKDKIYGLDEAINLVKKTATAGFKESVDVSVQLGIDAKNLIKMLEELLCFPKDLEKK